MSPVEWTVEKSKDVSQQCYHWLEVTSKHEILSGEKVSDTVKITLALQNVRSNLAQSPSVNVSETTTWSQVHVLLINYNNAAPVETKGVYQFNMSDKKEEVNFVKKGKGKGHKSEGPQKGKGALRQFQESRRQI